MADRKVTELTALTTANSADLLYVVDNPSGTPESKKVSLLTLLGNLPANTSVGGTLAATGNVTFTGTKVVADTGTLTLTSSTAVASNNAETVFGVSGMQGSIFWDSNYLYVATSNTVIKRVALSTFS
jgi:hypothetical protein